MENLRWILIVAGVAILVLLWFSGRSSRRRAATPELPDTLLDDEPAHTFGEKDIGNFEEIGIDGDDMARPGDPAANQPGRTAFAPAHAGAGAFDAPSGGGFGGGLGSGLGSLAQKFEAIGARLAPKRRQRVAEMESTHPEGDGSDAQATKIMTLHVVAPEGQNLPADALYEQFMERGYHHGEMNIFHSMSEGTTVYSVARMVKPGYFDLDDMSTFDTPGISFILQLPGPVLADTAFEVMLSEAQGMAAELGASVLDDTHSALGKQTEQHLRESIYEFMHRQKYADGVAG